MKACYSHKSEFARFPMLSTVMQGRCPCTPPKGHCPFGIPLQLSIAPKGGYGKLSGSQEQPLDGHRDGVLYTADNTENCAKSE